MAVTDDVFNRIKEMIRSGELAPGDRLPPEKELGELLGASRNSLREAVKALEVIRVLDVRRGDGTYVTSLEPQVLMEVMSFAADLHSDDSVLEMFAVRRMLEPPAAAHAAVFAEQALREAIERGVDGVNADASVEALVKHDSDFHRLIVGAVENGYLAGLVDSLAVHTVRARLWRALTQSGAADRTVAEHRAIAKAIAEGDSGLAAALMTSHIAGIESWLREAKQAGS